MASRQQPKSIKSQLDQKTTSARDNVLVLADFDNTICPTDVLAVISADELHGADQAAAQAIRAMNHVGRLNIITNSDQGWVHLTLQTAPMPSVQRALHEQKVPIVSAKTTFEAFDRDNPLFWKLAAFMTAFNSQPTIPQNVIVVGDDWAEVYAGQLMEKIAGVPVQIVHFSRGHEPHELAIELRALQTMLPALAQRRTSGYFPMPSTGKGS